MTQLQCGGVIILTSCRYHSHICFTLKTNEYICTGNGTAGTAMALPVFEGGKWRSLSSNLCIRYRMPLRAVHCSLGHLHMTINECVSYTFLVVPNTKT